MFDWARRAKCLTRLCSGSDLELVNGREIELNQKKNKSPEEFTIYAAQCKYCGRIVHPDPYMWAKNHKEETKDENDGNDGGVGVDDGRVRDEGGGEG